MRILEALRQGLHLLLLSVGVSSPAKKLPKPSGKN